MCFGLCRFESFARILSSDIDDNRVLFPSVGQSVSVDLERSVYRLHSKMDGWLACKKHSIGHQNGSNELGRDPECSPGMIMMTY